MISYLIISTDKYTDNTEILRYNGCPIKSLDSIKEDMIILCS